MSRRRALVPLGAMAIAYVSFGIAIAILAITNDPEWHHVDDLNFAEFSLSWGLFALAAVTVSLTSLAVLAAHIHWLVRIAVIVLNLPVLAAVVGALTLSIWGFQNYAAGYAAYDAAQQACGGPPVIVATGFGASYMLPGDADYDRLRYASHAQHLFFNNEYIYYCTEADAIAHGYHRFP